MEEGMLDNVRTGQTVYVDKDGHPVDPPKKEEPEEVTQMEQK
ncbi:MAG: hypothetical protein ABSG75_11130 [Syntrophales bacterium]|jgi:hypothetical protein